LNTVHKNALFFFYKGIKKNNASYERAA